MGTTRQFLPSFVTGRQGLGTWRQPFLRKNVREEKGAETAVDLRGLAFRLLPGWRLQGLRPGQPAHLGARWKW